MNKILRIFVIAATALSALFSCEKPEVEKVEYLEVNANNIAGKWALVEWNGSSLAEGTYVYLDIIRNDRTYTMYQNIDSFKDVPHIVTGSYYLENDPQLGAVIRGNYDYDSGEWAHRYVITCLTATEMIWTAKDDDTFVQKFERVDSIPQ